LERVKGIEPSSSAWKAVALPLSYTRGERAAHLEDSGGLRYPSRNLRLPVKHALILATDALTLDAMSRRGPRF
jgi:hypothetical protein